MRYKKEKGEPNNEDQHNDDLHDDRKDMHV